MRRAAGVIVALLGVVLVLLGGAAALLVGPDNTVRTDMRRIQTKTAAFVTAPSLMKYVGPQLRVKAAAANPAEKIFIGVAHETDVTSYFGEAGREELRKVGIPGRVSTVARGDETIAPIRPVGLDFWVKSASGPGTQELVWKITDGRWNVMISAEEPRPGFAAHVSFGVTVPGLFPLTVLVALAGPILVSAGVLLIRRRRPSQVTEPPLSADPFAVPWAQPIPTRDARSAPPAYRPATPPSESITPPYGLPRPPYGSRGYEPPPPPHPPRRPPPPPPSWSSSGSYVAEPPTGGGSPPRPSSPRPAAGDDEEVW